MPYQQTEVYRFGNAIVDDWEGRVNAWPLDEGLIDYVDTGYGTDSEDNPLYTANVIASTTLEYGAEPIDASEIDRTLLDDTLHEIGGIEANVAIGYHAIEFLLWARTSTAPDRATHAAMSALKQRAETIEAYDQMLAADSAEGNAVVQAAIDALTTQTRSIERIVAALDLQPIQIEGSDSLDDPAAVFGS